MAISITQNLSQQHVERLPLQIRETTSKTPSPKRKVRRHTLASSAAAATREFRFEISPCVSPMSARVLGPPLVPPKSPHRLQTSLTREGSASKEGLLDSQPEEDDISAILKELLSEMDTTLMTGDSPTDGSSSTLSRATTLCDRPLGQDYGARMKRTDVKRSPTSSSIDTVRHNIQSTQTSESLHPAAPIRVNTKNVSKVWQYSNSRLPNYLPCLKVHTTAWPLLTLAAQSARRAYRVYDKGELQVSRNQVVLPTTQKTKPAILQSVIVDDTEVVVLAIRGTAGFRDWIVNTDHLPSSPGDFLDDHANLCHSGFLRAARAMADTVAARLKALLDARSSSGPVDLLLTGHSAGGAVTQLFYSHMLATTTNSALKDLAPAFQRIHCITFGAPPLSIRPIRKPLNLAHRDSLFIAFANEGDPVVRSDKNVFKSLIRLYLSTVPQTPEKPRLPEQAPQVHWFWQCLGYRKAPRRDTHILGEKAQASSPCDPIARMTTTIRWKVPPSTLALAGSVVLLREKGEDGFGRTRVEACQVSNDLLQGYVFGDPSQHIMRIYLERIEDLAKEAVTGAYLHTHLF